MKIKDVFPVLEELAPLGYAEDFDNVGLLIGNENEIVTGILVCHDALEAVIDEAVQKKCNLIVCFHPILFSGLKKITGKNYVERAVIKAIRNDIAIYALHTALDNHPDGVNSIFCNTLGIENSNILIPKKNFIQKLVAFVPNDNVDQVLNALFDAGAGNIGNYEKCSYSSQGVGTFMGNAKSNPVEGKRFEFVQGEETKIEVTFEKHLQGKILKALFENHVYEEVAHEVYDLQNQHQNIGLGRIGMFENALSEQDFMLLVKEKLQCDGIRHSKFLGKPIKKVAVLGGSGSFAIKDAIRSGADAYITSDVKYHQFYEAENELLLLDIGHFESERYTKNYILAFLKEKITNFAIILSDENTNPVKYF
jgi:dinuclear metal center YbgI/SA1388 family protein